MALLITGASSRRAAALRLLIAFAVVTMVRNASAQTFQRATMQRRPVHQVHMRQPVAQEAPMQQAPAQQAPVEELPPGNEPHQQGPFQDDPYQAESHEPYYTEEGYGWDEGMACDDGCCDSCSNYGGNSRMSCWIGAEYLNWDLTGDRLPPLVTDSPDTTPLDEAGQLDDPTTRILSGNEDVGDDWRDGFRVFGGVWLDCCHSWALSADYFVIGNDDYNFLTGDSAGRIVTRPFFNTETGEDDAELVSVPDELSGTVEVELSDDFEGGGVALNHCLWRCCSPCDCSSRSMNLITGYRHYRYDSALTITENLLVLPDTTSPLVPGTTIFVQDRFIVRNDFHGGEIGLAGCYRRSWCWVDGLAKVAIGTNSRTVIIDGETTNTVPNAGSSTAQGGLLTSEVTNIGRYTDNDFVGIPEFRIGIGALVTHGISVRAGYNVIIWNDVMRISSALPPNLAVDPRNLPPVQAGGGDDPRFAGIRGSNFVAHGLSAGLEWSY